MKWYTNSANQSDIVLSTRVRLARNLEEYPFPNRLNKAEREKINGLVKDIFIGENSGLKYIPMPSLTSYQAVSLAEKHLISPEFASDSTGRALILSDDEDVSIMLCEEDHVRIQVIYPGLTLDEAYSKAAELDEQLSSKVKIAFDERIGYLTQCPTNLGTGMRASVMLHLPALTKSAAMSRLASTVAKLGMILRGTYGEGSAAVGDIYQLSNQVTLGISEKAAIDNLKSITQQIIEQERQARLALIKDEAFVDEIWRAYGIIKNARMISCNEFCSLVSLVRLGAAQGLINIPLETLSRLLIEMQPATINANAQKVYPSQQRDVIRATQIREQLKDY